MVTGRGIILTYLGTAGTAAVTFTVPAGSTELLLATDTGTAFSMLVTVVEVPVDDEPSTGSSALEFVGI